MTKAFTPDADGPNGQAQGMKSLHVGAQEVQNQDKTFAMMVADASLSHPKLRTNNFFSTSFAVTSGTWVENLKFRPRAMVQSFLRLRNAGTGAFNATTATLNLANGTGGKAAGDVFVFTWKNNGPQNDNLTGFLVWAKRSASAGTSKIRVALLDITALATAGGITTPASGLNLDAITLDADNYYTAAVAYNEINFDDVSNATNGGPLYINLNYNSKEIRTTALIDGHVYAFVFYLVRGGAETGLFTMYGGANAALTNQVSFYRGAAGWSGLLATDTTLKVPFHKIFKTALAVIDQIHIYAQSPNSLAGTVVESMTVEPNDDTFMNNVPNSEGELFHREVIGRLNLANERRHSIMLEGKAVIPRNHCACLFVLPSYTGTMYIEFNYWINPCGDDAALKV